MSSDLDIKIITEKYRLLGLPVGANPEQLRAARNKMMMKFHPDRHPEGWTDDAVPLEKRVHLVQSAYRYLMEHYRDIEAYFEREPMALTSRTAKQNRSHWIYTQIAQFDSPQDEIALLNKSK